MSKKPKIHFNLGSKGNYKRITQPRDLALIKANTSAEYSYVNNINHLQLNQKYNRKPNLKHENPFSNHEIADSKQN